MGLLTKKAPPEGDLGSWSSIPTAVERDEVADLDATGWKQRLMRSYAWASVIATPILIFLVIVLLVSPNTDATQMAAPSINTSGSAPGQIASYRAVASWLAAKPSPLPGGKVIGFNGATQVKATVIKDSNGKNISDDSVPPGVKQYTDIFSLVDLAGNGYTAGVQVAVDPAGGATVISGVSLTPVLPGANLSYSSMTPWPGLQAVQATPTVQSAVASWATAYASGNANTLRLAVGDQNGSHAYLPLTGVSKVTTSTGAVAATDASGGTVLVRVTLSLLWTGQAVPENSGTPDVATTMDVLVVNAKTGAPRVVAWGTPGSGPTLKAYGNAYTPAATGFSTPPVAPTTSATPTAKG